MQSDPSLEDATTAKASAETSKPTSYVVLAMVPLTDRADAVAWMLVGDGITARSADAALRVYAEKAEKTIVQDGSMTLLAVPSRSWRPVKVTAKVETTLVIEGA